MPMKHTPQWVSGLLRWLVTKAQRLVHAKTSPQSSDPQPRHTALGRVPVVVPERAYATVVIPALNEARRIAAVVAYALSDPATAQVIVIDDSSIDDTAKLALEAGATVLTSAMLGKGVSMREGLAPATCELVVYLDGDLAGLRPHIITDLCAPLLRNDADFVKAGFGRGGGRVTELTAKPMLKIFFPELAHFSQPLGGLIAAKKSLLQALQFEDGYGVDIGLLVDAHRAGARLAEVEIGSLEHESQPLHDLTFMANEVGRVIFGRAKAAGRLHVDQISAMYESQRQAAAGIDYVLMRRKGRQRLLLLDMDTTLTPVPFSLALARATGQETAYLQIMGAQPSEPATRSAAIARLFQYVHKKKFEVVALANPIRPDVIPFVNHMRRRGFMVGVVSDGYFVAADIVRRRLHADFAIANSMGFENDVCTGNLRINSAFFSDAPDADEDHCKSNVLQRFLDDSALPRVELTLAVSNNPHDLPLMRLANHGFSVAPQASTWASSAPVVVVQSFEELLSMVPDHVLVPANTKPPA